jgi:hypothetical protein
MLCDSKRGRAPLLSGCRAVRLGSPASAWLATALLLACVGTRLPRAVADTYMKYG